MVVIKVLSVTKRTILNLHEDFINERIVGIIKHVIHIVSDDF